MGAERVENHGGVGWVSDLVLMWVQSNDVCRVVSCKGTGGCDLGAERAANLSQGVAGLMGTEGRREHLSNG